MEADDERDMKFISLLRQSSTLPFAPMPKTISTEKSWRTSPGTVYAVFQPIEHISKHVLLDLEQSHRDRFQWQTMQRADFAKSMQRAVRGGTAPVYDALAQPSPHQVCCLCFLEYPCRFRGLPFSWPDNAEALPFYTGHLSAPLR